MTNKDTQAESRHSLPEDRLVVLIEKANLDQEKRLKEYIDEHIAELTAVIKSAYPEGDLSKHKYTHEVENKKAARWENIKTEFVTKLFTGGMYAAGVFVLTVIWEYLKTEARK